MERINRGKIDELRVNTEWTPEAPISQQIRDMEVAAESQLTADRAELENVVREIFNEIEEHVDGFRVLENDYGVLKGEIISIDLSKPARTDWWVIDRAIIQDLKSKYLKETNDE